MQMSGEMARMEPRDRMFAAIGREPVDRFPFSTYNCHPFAWGAHLGEPAYEPILRKIDETSAGCLCKTSARAKTARSAHSSETRTEGDTSYTTVTWHTPKGPLTRVTRTPAGQPGMCVKPYIVEPVDVERYLSVTYELVRWDVSTAVEHATELGPKGIAYLGYGDPFYHVSDLFDQEDFAIRVITEPDFIRQLVDAEFERVRGNLQTMLEALAGHDVPFLFYTAGPERATPPLLSPDVFERLVVPYQTKLVNLIHDAGYPASLHCHGRVRDVLPHAITCGYDVIEPLEPPPQGDIELKDLREVAGDRIALMGYVQDQDFYLLSEAEMRGRIHEITTCIGDSSGYICCPTCTPFQYPPTEAYVRNFVAFLDEADKGN